MGDPQSTEILKNQVTKAQSQADERGKELDDLRGQVAVQKSKIEELEKLLARETDKSSKLTVDHTSAMEKLLSEQKDKVAIQEKYSVLDQESQKNAGRLEDELRAVKRAHADAVEKLSEANAKEDKLSLDLARLNRRNKEIDED